MESFATNGQSRPERRPTRRLRRMLGVAAAGSAMSVVLANPALAASPSAVENTVAAAAGVANNVVQSTPAANVAPPAPPAPSPAADPAPAPSDPAPPEPAPAAGGVSETSGGDNTVEQTSGGAVETVNDALTGLAGKTATDLTDTVDKASAGIVGGPAPKPPAGESLGGEAVRPPAGSPGQSDPPSGSSSPLTLLPKLTIAPILPANPILSNEPLLPGLLDLGGILGAGGPVAGLLPALGETLGKTLGGLPTPGLDLGGILGGGLQLIAPFSGGGTIPPSPPGVAPGLSDPQSGSLIDPPYGSHVLTHAPDLPATPQAAAAPNSVPSAAQWDSLITDSMSSTSSPSVESAAPAGGSPSHRPLPGPASPSGAVSPAPNGLLLFGFAAMLLAALAAAAPAIRRLIQIAPACWRPAPFVALLEPPG
jgi:hypothetical protein